MWGSVICISENPYVHLSPPQGISAHPYVQLSPSQGDCSMQLTCLASERQLIHRVPMKAEVVATCYSRNVTLKECRKQGAALCLPFAVR